MTVFRIYLAMRLRRLAFVGVLHLRRKSWVIKRCNIRKTKIQRVLAVLISL